MLPETLKRAISIRQPHVEAIFRLVKLEEYRSRPTRFKGRVYIYATKTLAEKDYGFPVTDIMNLPRGVILGSVEIAGCIYRGTEDYAYTLRDPRRYDEPFKPGGQPQPCFWFPRLA